MVSPASSQVTEGRCEMMRAVGETFRYADTTLRVVKDEYPYCDGCYFEYRCCMDRDKDITGECAEDTELEVNTKFVEVEEGGGK